MGDMNIPRKATIFGGMGLIILGTIFIQPIFLTPTDKWAATMLCIINMGSGLSQVRVR